MIQPQTTTSISDFPLYREVAWNYNENRPVFRRGEPVIVTGKDAIKVWIYKGQVLPTAKKAAKPAPATEGGR